VNNPVPTAPPRPVQQMLECASTAISALLEIEQIPVQGLCMRQLQHVTLTHAAAYRALGKLHSALDELQEALRF